MDPVARRVVEALPELPTPGGQLHVGRGEDVTDLATGDALPGEPLTAGHVFNVYCAAKPLAVMATLAALESAGHAGGPDVPLSELTAVPGTTPFGALTLGDLVGHRTRLGVPDVFTFLLASDEARAVLLDRLDRSLARRRRVTEHSTLGLSYVLTVICRRMVGASLGEVLGHHLAATGLTRSFVRVPAGAAPIGVYVDRTRGRHLPMLHDRLPYYCDSPHGELVGLYTCAADLGRWGRQMNAVLRGEDRPGFPRPATVAAHVDAGRDTPAPGFAAGLQRGLPDHGLVSAPPSGLGQFGFVRSSLLYLDPERDLVLAGIHADLSMDDLDRRRDQWDAAIGALTAGESEAAA